MQALSSLIANYLETGQYEKQLSPDMINWQTSHPHPFAATATADYSWVNRAVPLTKCLRCLYAGMPGSSSEYRGAGASVRYWASSIGTVRVVTGHLSAKWKWIETVGQRKGPERTCTPNYNARVASNYENILWYVFWGDSSARSYSIQSARTSTFTAIGSTNYQQVFELNWCVRPYNSPYVSPDVCYITFRSWSGYTIHSVSARTQFHLYHANLHSCNC